jgi:hypothetical protein
MKSSADTITLLFAPTQDARHATILRANEIARAMVERMLAKQACQKPDEDGVLPEPDALFIAMGVAENDRSLRQNRFYWGVVLKQIADQAPGKWTVDAWHEAFKRTVLGYEIVKVSVAGRKRPTVYRRLRSTTGLKVKPMSDYLDQVMATAATDLGVVFDIDPVEREAVRYRKPVRAKKETVAA